jgi:cytochrome c-type biogenesis protein CcmH
MRRWKSSLLVLALAAVCLAQSTTPLANARVRRLGDQLMCLCGCGSTVTSCNMLECRFSRPARDKLLAMVDAGMPDSAILSAFVKEYGVQILVRPPARGFNLLGYVMPFAGIALGLAFVWWVIKRFRKPVAAPAGPALDDATFAAYQARIEKDLEKLDS